MSSVYVYNGFRSVAQLYGLFRFAQVLLSAVQQLQQLNNSNSGREDGIGKNADVVMADEDPDEDVALLEEGEMEENTSSHTSNLGTLGAEGRAVEMSGEDTQDTPEGSVATMLTD